MSIFVLYNRETNLFAHVTRLFSSVESSLKIYNNVQMELPFGSTAITLYPIRLNLLKVKLKL